MFVKMEKINSRKKHAALIPAYNEEKNIRKVVNTCFNYVSEVIVVNDKSIDKTLEELAKTSATVLNHKKNKGKGAALKTGFSYGRQNEIDYVITLDGDGQHRPEEIPLFTNAMKENYDLILGCRKIKGTNMPYIRKFANLSSSWLMSLQLSKKIPDSQCGFRAIKLKSLDNLELRLNKYDLESEIIQKMVKSNAKVGFVPISTIYNGEKSKVRQIVDPLRFVATLFRF